MRQSQRLTPDQVRRKAADNLKMWRSQATGRSCKHCGVGDKKRGFSKLNVCMNCAKAFQRNGNKSCEHAGCSRPALVRKTKFQQESGDTRLLCKEHRPKRPEKLRKKPKSPPCDVAACRYRGRWVHRFQERWADYDSGMRLCMRHILQPEESVPVILQAKGKMKTIPTTIGAEVILCSGIKNTVGQLLDEYPPTIVVDPQDLLEHKFRDPLAVVGVDPVPTRDTAYTLLEFSHNPGVDDETGNKTLSPEWFQLRFGRGKQLKTWKRAFERTKQRFRALGLDPTNIDMKRLHSVLALGEAAWFGEV